MRYILLMTLAGSILFGGYLLMEKKIGKHMTQAGRYRSLVIVIFTYLIPWNWLKAVYVGLTFDLAGGLGVPVSTRAFVNAEWVDVRVVNGVTVTPHLLYEWVFLAAWCLGAAVTLVHKCVCYFVTKKSLLRTIEGCSAELSEEVLERVKKELRCRRRIRILPSCCENRSMAVGLLKPVIFLQESKEEGETVLILRHELTHTVRGDCWLKLLIGLVECIHWFNPMVRRLLYKVFDRVCETSCDERVAGLCSDREELKRYADLVVDSMKELRWGNTCFSQLSGNYNYARERVEVIMKRRKITRWGRVMTAGVFALMLFVDSLTALAYPTVSRGEYEDGTPVEIDRICTIVITENGEDSRFYQPAAAVLCDRQFVYPDGSVIPASEQETMALCLFHNYVYCQYQEHTKYGDGSCVVETYECQRCSKCGHYIVGDKISESTYNTCPH